MRLSLRKCRSQGAVIELTRANRGERHHRFYDQTAAREVRRSLWRVHFLDGHDKAEIARREKAVAAAAAFFFSPPYGFIWDNMGDANTPGCRVVMEIHMESSA
jgi:hypothetical protein